MPRGGSRLLGIMPPWRGSLPPRRASSSKNQERFLENRPDLHLAVTNLSWRQKLNELLVTEGHLLDRITVPLLLPGVTAIPFENWEHGREESHCSNGSEQGFRIASDGLRVPFHWCW